MRVRMKRADGYGIPQNLSDGAVDRILIGICMTGQYAQSMGNCEVVPPITNQFGEDTEKR